ncbi:uncharacterized protein LOC143258886 [Megalopta genalis]|uniref:uncharacterized protein LOC143258886 n=1 Tax=Megalopta genalis TaxID=115081 RepID=UPI0014436E3B|nr:uncharacterized protein LOC117228590 [Megalopta genalis]
MENSTIACIGKSIIDGIEAALSNPVGIQHFRNYLEIRGLLDLMNDIRCLNLYKIGCVFIDELWEEPLLEDLIDKVQAMLKKAEELEGVTEIDRALLESLIEAINSKSSSALLAVLKDIIDRCRNLLKEIHKEYTKYVSEPHPLTK